MMSKWRTAYRQMPASVKTKYRAQRNQILKTSRIKRGMQPALWRSALARARRQGLKFALKPSDIIIPSHCPVLGVRLIQTLGGKRRDNSPSIDRINNRRGYMPDNIVVVCWRVNRLKSDATLDELRRVARYYAREVK